MVFPPSRTIPLQSLSEEPTPHDGSHDETASDRRGATARAIVDLIDAVGNVRDGDHLQCLSFLAQEFRLLTEPYLVFGTIDDAPPRPHSLLLEGHFYTLLSEGVLDLDGTGRLRLRRDLFTLPSSGLANRRLSALAALSPYECLVFAAAVRRLTRDGCYAGSRRHDDAFRATVELYVTGEQESYSPDPEAICAARQRLLPTGPLSFIATPQ